MATKQTPPAAPVAEGAAAGAGPSEATATAAAHTPTPENTPVPGGGRYRWDIAAPGWVDIDAAASPNNANNPTQPE